MCIFGLIGSASAGLLARELTRSDGPVGILDAAFSGGLGSLEGGVAASLYSGTLGSGNLPFVPDRMERIIAQIGLNQDEVGILDEWHGILQSSEMMFLLKEEYRPQGGVRRGLFESLATMPEVFLNTGFKGIGKLRASIIGGDRAVQMSQIGEALRLGSTERVVAALDFEIIGDMDLGLLDGGVLDTIFNVRRNEGGVLRRGLFFKGRGFLDLICLEGVVSAVRERFALDGTVVSFSQVMDLLALQELVDAKHGVVDSVIDFKVKVAQTSVGIVRSLGQLKLAALEVVVRPFALALYFLANVVQLGIMTVQNAIPALYFFVPINGFGCRDGCDTLSAYGDVSFPIGGSDELLPRFKEMLAETLRVERVWTEYIDILGVDAGFNYRDFIGGYRGCKNVAFGEALVQNDS